jgi:hypothetical protein
LPALRDPQACKYFPKSICGCRWRATPACRSPHEHRQPAHARRIDPRAIPRRALRQVDRLRPRGWLRAADPAGSSDYLRGIALNNRDSLYAAITNVAAIGVSLNPAEKLAYLVPRKKAVCLDISYMGLLDIAQSAGAIRWGQAVIVREKDTFELQGIDKEPKHTYQPFAERGAIIGVYVVVKTPTATTSRTRCRSAQGPRHPRPLGGVEGLRRRLVEDLPVGHRRGGDDQEDVREAGVEILAEARAPRRRPSTT